MTTDPYTAILERKARYAQPAGFRAEVAEPWLFPFQRRSCEWALHGGRRALFLSTGLGKTRVQLAWADRVQRHTGGRVLILAPLAVGPQTEREAAAIGMPGVRFSRTADVDARIVVTNYDSLDHFDNTALDGVVTDESSILKAYTGAIKQRLCERFKDTPYRLCATATPSPNDHLELGNHSEFLGILSSHQMIARWFINDTSAMGKYRLKGHAETAFWDWVASWAICATMPSDIDPSYDDTPYHLPPLNMHRQLVSVDIRDDKGGLFRQPDMSATGVHKEKRRTVEARAARAAELVAAEPAEPWLIWCDTDYEADALMRVLPKSAVEVSGPMSQDVKAKRLLNFADNGGILVTKAKIAGYGLNLQGCARTIFAGGSYSFEAFYQALRRNWRFGQTRPVEAHVILAYTEQHLWNVVAGKAENHQTMNAAMLAATRRAQGRHSAMSEYEPAHRGRLPAWLTSSHGEPDVVDTLDTHRSRRPASPAEPFTVELESE
jgi:hypothetical protein